jgi:hypothetical protein
MVDTQRFTELVKQTNPDTTIRILEINETVEL